MSSSEQENFASTSRDSEPEQNNSPGSDNAIHSESVSPEQGTDDMSELPEYSQVSSRLKQIRGYIRETNAVMEQLREAGTPKHLEQYVKLADMLEGLRDSEMKLEAILITFDKLELEKPGSVPSNSNAGTSKHLLKMKVEESEKKLSELKDQQAALLALKQQARDQKKEAQTAEATQTLGNTGCISGEKSLVDQLQMKLRVLQTKAELMNRLDEQFDQISECNGKKDGVSRNSIEDKMAELAVLKEMHSLMVGLVGLTGENSQNPVERGEVHNNTPQEQGSQVSLSQTLTNGITETSPSVHQLRVRARKLQETKSNLQYLDDVLNLIEAFSLLNEEDGDSVDKLH